MVSWTPDEHYKAMKLIDEMLEIEPNNYGVKKFLISKSLEISLILLSNSFFSSSSMGANCKSVCFISYSL